MSNIPKPGAAKAAPAPKDMPQPKVILPEVESEKIVDESIDDVPSVVAPSPKDAKPKNEQIAVMAIDKCTYGGYRRKEGDKFFITDRKHLSSAMKLL